MQAIVYLGGKCQICAYVGSPMAYDFHHTDPTTKDFNISARMTSFEAIRAELHKCVLLCARCHREVHDGLHPAYLVDADSERGQLPLGDDDSFEEDVECEY